MAEGRSRRVFFALWPDGEATGHLSALAHSLAAGGGRTIQPVSLHLTLAFIGSVTSAQVEELERIASGVRGTAFDLSLDRLGFWPRGGTLWAGCRRAPAPLRRLAEALVTDLRAGGFAVDVRSGSELVAHVTLARHVRCASLPRLGTPIGWRVGEFSLVESHLHPSAASYKTLASFPLDEADDACE